MRNFQYLPFGEVYKILRAKRIKVARAQVHVEESNEKFKCPEPTGGNEGSPGRSINIDVSAIPWAGLITYAGEATHSTYPAGYGLLITHCIVNH